MAGMMMALIGAAGLSVRITDQIVVASDTVAAPGTATATASYQLQANGVARQVVNGVAENIPGQWLLVGAAGDHEVLFTLVSGSFTFGTFGSWLNLGTLRVIENTATRSSSGITTETGVATVQIRRVGGSDILASATVTCTAEANVES